MTDSSYKTQYDAIVVGARVAGASTAMLLARRGLSVLAIDQSPYGSDTLSTHALMRGGVLQLKRWGLLPALEALGAPPVRRTLFGYGQRVIDVPIKARDGIDALYAPRRTSLDRMLCDAASEAGADVRHGARLLRLLRRFDGSVSGAVIQTALGGVLEVRAPMVIGADGRHSRVAKLVDAPIYHGGVHSTACVYAYFAGLSRQGYHWLFNMGAQGGTGAGAIPTDDGMHCVFASAPARRFDEDLRFDLQIAFERLLAECAPELAAEVEGARRVSPLRGFSGHPGYFRRSHGPGWALVGDAGYFKDPLTAHGITDALRDAELLANAVATGTPAALLQYELRRDTLSRPLFDLTEYVASCAWDLEQLELAHRAMSKEMNRECEVLSGLDDRERRTSVRPAGAELPSAL